MYWILTGWLVDSTSIVVDFSKVAGGYTSVVRFSNSICLSTKDQQSKKVELKFTGCTSLSITITGV